MESANTDDDATCELCTERSSKLEELGAQLDASQGRKKHCPRALSKQDEFETNGNISAAALLLATKGERQDELIGSAASFIGESTESIRRERALVLASEKEARWWTAGKEGEG